MKTFRICMMAGAFVALGFSSQPYANETLARSSVRIINGDRVEPGDAPWAVSLREGGTHICGGSLISPIYAGPSFAVTEWSSLDAGAKFVLTAAHCVSREGKALPPDGFDVYSGDMNLTSGKGEIQKVLGVVVHPDYNPATLENDIAILRVSEVKRKFSKLQRNSIRLPTPLESLWIDQPYLATHVAGWGRTESGFASAWLLSVRLPKVEREFCQTKYQVHGDAVARTMFCAGFSSGEYDSCQGDSGGGIYYSKADGSAGPGFSGGTPVLLGLVSWGRGCANPNLFGVYTDVRPFDGWIRKVTQELLQNM